MFSWSSSGSRRQSASTYPGNRSTPVAQVVSGSIRPPTYTRQEHLDSYLNDATLKPSTRRVSSDDSTHDTVFQTTSGDALILRVRLPPVAHSSAPSRAPAMSLVGVDASHPWLDSRMCIVGYSEIASDAAWQSSGMLLGVAVNNVVRQLQLEPPRIRSITDPGLQRIQQRINGTSNHDSGSQQQRGTPSRNGARKHGISHPDAPPDYESLRVPEIRLPDIPTEFPQLNNKSRDELQSMLDDELDFLTMVHSLPVYQQTQKKAIAAMDENVQLAKANLSLESETKELHTSVVSLKENLEKKVQEFQLLEQQQDALIAPPDVNDVTRKLTRAKKEAFEESEDLAMKWIDEGNADNVNDFVKEFLEVRALHHTRAAKLERLKVGTSATI